MSVSERQNFYSVVSREAGTLPRPVPFAGHKKAGEATSIRCLSRGCFDFLSVKKRLAYFTSVTTTAFRGISLMAISLPLALTLPRMFDVTLFVLFCSMANSAS